MFNHRKLNSNNYFKIGLKDILINISESAVPPDTAQAFRKRLTHDHA